MNSLRPEETLDNLFRRALKPTAEALPPADAWRGILDVVQADQLSQTQAPSVEPLPKLSLVAHILRLFRWRRTASWVNSFSRVYPPSSSDLRCAGPGGGCSPSPFTGVFVTELFELRLAS